MNTDHILTGVTSDFSEFFHSDIDQGIDLSWEEYISSAPDENTDPAAYWDYAEQYEQDCPTILVGAWSKDDAGLYDADPTSTDYDYAAIVTFDNGPIAQVVWSRYAIHCAPCSPCYPDQGDIDNPSADNPRAVMAYTLPSYAITDQDTISAIVTITPAQ